MEKNTLNRLKIELESFKILVSANMIGAALTLAFSMAFGIEKVIPFITGGPLTPGQLPYFLLIISGFATVISWITSSAELMEEHDIIVKDLKKVIENYDTWSSDDSLVSRYDDEIIGIIVRSLSFYRENTDKINNLKWGGRLTGAFLLAQGFAIVSSLGVGVAAWYVPVIIKRFTETWDARLSLADDANEKLKGILEGTD